MIHRLSGFILKYIFQTVLIAALYILMARLGFLMALPPGNVTPLWPPSGVALAAGMILGYHIGIGVWLGSFLVNMTSLSGGTAPLASALIASGSTLQVVIAVFLLRRFVVPRFLHRKTTQAQIIAPTTPREALIFIGITALAALMAPTIGVASLSMAGYASWANFFTLWWTWWFGDYAGMLTIAPTLIVITLWLRKQASDEPIFFPLACIWLGLALIAFSFIWRFEEQNLASRLHVDTIQITHDLQQVIDQNTQQLAAFEAFYAASSQVQRAEFHTFSLSLLHDGPSVQAFAWVPRVSLAERATYEQAAQQSGFPTFEFSEINAAGRPIAAGQRDEYFPVYFIEPYAGNEVAQGFDLASDKVRLKAIVTARDTGRFAATAPIKLVQEPGQQKGILILAPVYRPGALVNSIETRRANLLGVISGVFRTGDMLEAALRNRAPDNVELYLFDTTSGDAQFITFYSCQGRVNIPENSEKLKPAALLTGFYRLTDFNLGERKWLAIARACPVYVASERGPEPWAVLLIGFALSGIVLSYTEIRQRSETALRESESTTRQVIDNAPDAVIAVNEMGQIVLTNAQAETIFGYSHDELLEMSIEELLPERFRAQHLRHRLKHNANPVTRKMGDDQVFYGYHKDHHEFPVDIMLSSIETSLGHLSLATIRDITEQLRVEAVMAESEQTYRALFENANDAIFLLSLDAINQQVNQKAADLLGYTREELVGMSTREVIALSEYDDSISKVEAVMQGLVLPPYERLFRKKDGKTVLAEVNLSMVRDANGRRKYIQCIAHDITERKNSLEQIRQLNATLEQRVLERTNELQKEISERKKVEIALQLSHDQLEYSVAELERRNHEVTLLSELTEILESCYDANEAYQAIAHHLPRLFPEDAGVLYIISNSRNQADCVSQWGRLPMGMVESSFSPMDCWALRRGRDHTMESPLSDMICKHVTQTVPLPLPCTCAPMMAHGETIGVLHVRYELAHDEVLTATRKQLVITVAEQLALILANLNLRETLRNQSIRDALTGLFNRRYMEESVERELRRAERANRPLTVAMLDLDHFKRFNDTFGHAAGDCALRAMSDLLKNKMRAGDIVCRYGGEEFVIIFIEMTLENAVGRLEGLRENVRQLLIEYQGQPLGQLTVSIGAASYPEYGTTSETLLKAADDGLYRAKQTGRDRVVVIPLEPKK